MPKCDRYRELCSLSLDTELSDDDAVMLFKHLAECPACAAYLEDLHEMQKAWNDLKEPLPEDLHEKIMQAVTEQAEKQADIKNKGKRHFPVFTLVAAAAACVMLALSGSFAGILGKTSDDVEKTGVPSGQTTLEKIKPNDDNYEQGVAKARIVPEPSQSDSQQQQPVVPSTNQNDTQSPSVDKPQTTQPSNDNEQTQSTNKQTGNEDTSAQSPASAPATFSMVGGEQRTKTNAAESQSVKIPDELQTSSFAFCFVAVGGSEVPTISDAKFIEKNGNTYYFKVTGAISDFDKSLDVLQKSGFETAMRTDLGIKIDASASEGVLILVLSE